MQSLYIIYYMCSYGKKICLLNSEIFEVKNDLSLFSKRNFSGTALCILENGNDMCYACVLLTCFCFLLRLIYSALHRYTKFIDNFVCSIGSIFIKFHQESYLLYRILKNNDLAVIVLQEKGSYRLCIKCVLVALQAVRLFCIIYILT